MLILLLLAKGWAVTRQQISKTSWFLLMAIWIPYCAFHMVLYVWNRVSKWMRNPHKFEKDMALSCCAGNSINIKSIVVYVVSRYFVLISILTFYITDKHVVIATLR